MNERLGSHHPNEPFSASCSLDAAETYIRAAQHRLHTDRATGVAALDDIFACGEPPTRPLDGTYEGELVALDIAPGVTPFAEAIAAHWMPWQGKRFDAISQTGNNTFSANSYLPARLLWPAYRGYQQKETRTYRAFRFRTNIGPAMADAGRSVLRLDYDLAENPRLLIGVRRVLDELVQVADGFYLGVAYVHWYWGTWSRVAFFALRPSQ